MKEKKKKSHCTRLTGFISLGSHVIFVAFIRAKLPWETPEGPTERSSN